jgi:curved DNA-binding protein CbpA
MARGGGRRTTYVRDNSGRFASTPGGGPPKRSTPASRRAAAKKDGALKGGTLAARSQLRASRAKTTPAASRQQRGAVTRASRRLASAVAASKRQGPAMPGVLRGTTAKRAKADAGKAFTRAYDTARAKGKSLSDAYSSASKDRKAKLTKQFLSSGKKKEAKKTTKPARATAKKKAEAPARSAAKTTKKEAAKAAPTDTRKPNLRAQRIKAMVNRRGVVKGKNFNDGKDVETLSMAEIRSTVRKRLRSGGAENKKQFRFLTGLSEPPKTRSGWEKLYRQFVSVPMADRNRKSRPGVINGIDIQKNFRPWAVFNLDPQKATRQDVEQAFRRVAKQVHPDAGGRAKDFERVKKMRDSIVALMDEPSKPSKPSRKKSAEPKQSPSMRPRLLPPARSPKPRRKR